MENKIVEELKKLKKDINPRPEWIALRRDILLQQINPQKEYELAAVGLGGYVQLFTQVFRQRLLEPAVIILLVLGIFSASSLAINAAFYSLPGEPLYRVKIALEKTHVALTPDRGKKVELKVEFAQKRVAEFDKIVAQTNISPEAKKERIKEVVKEFKSNVTAVNDGLNKINQSIRESNIETADKEQTVRMAIAVGSKAEELAKSFDGNIDNLSEVEKQEVKEIIDQAVQSAQELAAGAAQMTEEANEVEEPTEKGEAGVVEGVSTGEDETDEVTDSTESTDGEILEDNEDADNNDDIDSQNSETAPDTIAE